MGGDAKLCSVTGRLFSLRQLNHGNRGSMVAWPFALLKSASHPDKRVEESVPQTQGWTQ